jgi:hypothetical protein
MSRIAMASLLPLRKHFIAYEQKNYHQKQWLFHFYFNLLIAFPVGFILPLPLWNIHSKLQVRYHHMTPKIA